MKQASGDMHLSIAWEYPGQTREVIRANHSRVTNPASCLVALNCGATLDTWTGIGGFTVDDLKVGSNNLERTPNRTERLGSLLETVPNQGGNFGSRMSGWLLPPVSGNYDFWIASDDQSEFWLSHGDDPANKTLICKTSSAVRVRDYRGTEQGSTPISLAHGQAYYFEVSVHDCLVFHVHKCLFGSQRKSLLPLPSSLGYYEGGARE